MSTTAGAKGAALPVTAEAGPPLAPHQEAALALAEVGAADDRLSRARAKLAKLRAGQAAAEAETEALVEQAEAEVNAVLEAACTLLGTEDTAQVRELAAAHVAEQARHEAELTRLLAAASGGDQ
jgi:hypothetical protein